MSSSEDTWLTTLQSWLTDSTLLSIEITATAPVKSPGVVFIGEGILSEVNPPSITFAVGASALAFRLGVEELTVVPDVASGTLTITSLWGRCVLKPKAPSASTDKPELIQ